MKQVCLVKGAVRVLDVPPPACGPRGVLVQTASSVISTGTELALAGSGRARALVRRALANPELMRRLWEKIGTVGVRQSWELVRARVTSTLPLGYSAAGEVIEVGRDVRRLKVGDRVACAGAGYANHAEVNFVPDNLVAPIPPGLEYPAAAFATVSAIALQGVRRLAPTLGEQVVVVGLGLIGQLAVQLLRFSGCRVVGIDLLPARIALARTLGLEDAIHPEARDPLGAVLEWTEGTGADAVLVCAAGGDVALLNRALDLCRQQGRLVLVGDVPIRMSREKLYRKEIDFLISSSSGPGRYDPRYEEQGLDYPLAYVRWTEGRNLAEVLRLMAEGRLRVAELVAATYPVEAAPSAYARLAGGERPVAVLLDYGAAARLEAAPSRAIRLRAATVPKPGQVVLGVIGAGSFFRSVHLPNLRRHGGFHIKAIATRTGPSALDLGARERIPVVTTDAREILEDPEIAAVLIATRHDLHAPFAEQAARVGKHVFVEKPMGLTVGECETVLDAVAASGVLLAVGFNRRFAPLARAARALLECVRAPKTLLYRINAGPLPPDHWLRDPREGGGRLLGEGVHFFDFVRWLLGADPVAVQATALDRGARGGPDADTVATTLAFADGSVATILYASEGDRALGKERIEVFGGGQALVLDDFATLDVAGPAGRRRERVRGGDKGHAALLAHFHRALQGLEPLAVTARDGYWATSCAELAERSLRTGARLAVRPAGDAAPG